MRVKVGGKVIPANFLKIEGRGMLVGVKDQRERGTDRRIGRWSEPRSSSTSQEQGKGERGGSKGNVTGGVTAGGAMEKGGCIRVIEVEEVRRHDPVEYFLSAGVRCTS